MKPYMGIRIPLPQSIGERYQAGEYFIVKAVESLVLLLKAGGLSPKELKQITLIAIKEFEDMVNDPDFEKSEHELHTQVDEDLEED